MNTVYFIWHLEKYENMFWLNAMQKLEAVSISVSSG